MASTRPVALLLVFVAAVVLVAYPLIVAVPSREEQSTPRRARRSCSTAPAPQRSSPSPTAAEHHPVHLQQGAPEYGITNEPAMIFSDDYLDAIEPFPTAGIWEVGTDDRAGTVSVRVGE